MSSWKNDKIKISKEFTFDTYMDGIDFVNKVGKLAEELNHHPEITIGYRVVKITSTTHSAGKKITDMDLELGNNIDEIYDKINK
ncbi:MAG: 4a-hydroxytetrahydrobiopterin dehydratase [Candidatus Hodarchaeales archaeon]|jgi:4a-hydroxytetrahydrobiopterin dehydratase